MSQIPSTAAETAVSVASPATDSTVVAPPPAAAVVVVKEEQAQHQKQQEGGDQDLNTAAGNKLIAPMRQVNGGPLHPYVSLKNSMVDAVSMMHMLHAVGRCTWEAGWLPPGVERSENFSVFMASQMLVLESPFSHHRHGIRRLPATADFTGRCGVLACPGGSSFSVFIETGIPLDTTHNMMGFGMCAIVRIDLKNRRPAKLPEDAKTLLQSQAAASGADARVKELGVTPLGRLPPAEDITAQASAAPTVASAVGTANGDAAAPQHVDPTATTSTDTAAPPSVRKFTFDVGLRPNSDFDFNGHVNQGVYLSWIQDAVAAWRHDVRADLADLKKAHSQSADPEQQQQQQEVVEPQPTDSDAAETMASKGTAANAGDGHDHSADEHIHADLRAFRLDYLGEIAQRQGTVRLSLYCDASAVAVPPPSDASAAATAEDAEAAQQANEEKKKKCSSTIRAHAIAAFGDAVVTRMEDPAGDYFATPPSHAEIPASCDGDGSGAADVELAALKSTAVLSRARRVVPFYFEIAPVGAKGPSSRGFILVDCFF